MTRPYTRYNAGSYDVDVHEDGDFAVFEHHVHGEEAGGALRFESVNGVATLYDYEGCYQVPNIVLDVLTNLGFDVSYAR